MGIPGNEIADLINWIKTEDKKIRWQNSENNMKNRKKRDRME
jgi:hypothetical protein